METFYAVCERKIRLMFTDIILDDFGKEELAYFKTLDEAKEFLKNIELYKIGRCRFKNSSTMRLAEYFKEGKNDCLIRLQSICFIERKSFY